jgi:hypothetical protein
MITCALWIPIYLNISVKKGGMKKNTDLIGFVSVFLLLLLFAVAGCTSQHAQKTPAYVSVCEYQIYSCKDLDREMEHIRTRVLNITGSQKNKATRDAVALGPGVVLWPVIYMLVSDNQKEELARLQGEYEALERVSLAKKCATDWNKIEVRKQQDSDIADSESLLTDW